MYAILKICVLFHWNILITHEPHTMYIDAEPNMVFCVLFCSLNQKIQQQQSTISYTRQVRTYNMLACIWMWGEFLPEQFFIYYVLVLFFVPLLFFVCLWRSVYTEKYNMWKKKKNIKNKNASLLVLMML